MPELLQSTQRLLQNYQIWHQSLQRKEGIPVIHVDEVASRVAAFYEKIRGVMDWREEHLLKKTAVERMLKRRFFLKKVDEEIAKPLVHELIRAGHFANDSIPEEKVLLVQKSINKYAFIIENAAHADEKTKINLSDWLLGIAACEIDEILYPPLKQEYMMEFMFEQMKEIITAKIPQPEIETQIYIAVQKALFKLDNPCISYNLLKQWYRQWLNLPENQIQEVTNNIFFLKDKIEENLNHALSEKFYEICERKDTAYLILDDILAESPTDNQTLFSNPATLESKMREAYRLRLQKVKTRMRRAATYSTISIFISKITLALAIEVPIDKYLNALNDLALSVNIFLPPLLMFFLALSIKPPSSKNEDLVVLEVMNIVYAKERKDIYEVKPAAKGGVVSNIVIGLLYLLSSAATFGLIIWGLGRLQFSFISIIIFIVFISLISFAGVKIRKRANELVVEKEKESFLQSLFDLFSLPIIQVGRWLSGQWARYNVLTVLFNSLLDMPFQIFVEFLEQWRIFLKEKKEKIR
ncbi:MAG: hypothetical protein HYT21_01095 [Candidatus Nealsonbacteria bacterium]|nr:hypothetical protein [Candidatus Nealsonbacteria bacterium]